MRSNDLRPLYILLVVYLMAGVALASLMIMESSAYNDAILEQHNVMTVESVLLDVDAWLDNDAGLLEQRQEAERLMTVANDYQSSMISYSWIIGALSLTVLLLVFLFHYNSEVWYKAVAVTLIGISSIMLMVGLFVPMIEIGCFYDDLHIPLDVNILGMSMDFSQTFEGRINFFYQSKSIMGVISLLFKNGNGLVGICILMFSVVIPFLKLIFQAAVLFNTKLHKRKQLRNVVSYLGKFSMADVFIAAIFLAYFALSSMQTGVETDSSSLPGMYFFLGYALLSIFSSVTLEWSIQAKKADALEESLPRQIDDTFDNNDLIA